MTPIRLSRTWTRRLYVGLFLLSFAYIGLALVPILQPGTIPAQFSFDSFVLLGAFLAAAGSIAGYVLVDKIQSVWFGFAFYLIFALTTAYAVIQTGGIASPFLMTWSIALFFAPLFGVVGWLPGLIVSGIYAASVYLGQGNLTFHDASLIVLSSLLPLAIGMLIWREVPQGDEAAERNVKNLASQLSEVAAKSEIVINAIGDGVIALDGKGIIQLINPAAQEILGWGKQDAMMLSYKSILKLVDQNSNELAPEDDPIDIVLNNNQRARDNDLVVATQSGKKISISLVVSPIGTPGAGVIVVFRDVTNEKAEEREQAEFISTASHEMRTPVASIEGYLGLVLNPNTAQIDQRARDFILKAHEAAQHLGRLFQDLLDVSKSEDGRMTNNPKVVDLVSYTQTITEGLTHKAADKNLQLIFKPTETSTVRKIMPVYYINQDNDHVREIIDNLIENAIKYTPEGSVTVDVNGTDEKVVVSIQDTGLGIPPEDLPHLFQKFYRVNNADRQAIGGTGLGLYLVRRLAEAMQGRVWVESKFGQGSTFFLELPRLASQEAEHMKEQQAQNTAQPPTVVPVAIAPEPVTEITEASQIAPIVPTRIAVTEVTEPTVQVTEQSSTPVQPETPQVIAPQPAPVVIAQPAPVAPPTPTPQAQPETQAARTAQAPNREAVRPATTVPRGESLTQEQKAERVRQLEELAKKQRSVPPERR